MDKKDLRIVFMGTPEFAVESLQRLVEGGYQVVAVVTQPDKPVGRHQDTLQAPPVKQYAEAHGIPVLQPVKMKDETFVEQLRSYQADIQVVVAFRMLPEVVWGMPRFGTFNVHAALLPQYRGAAPINWAVINGETQTGVTTFFLDKDIDTGRIIDRKTFSIPDEADVEYVYEGLMRLGAQLCIETIDKVIATDGQVPSVPQEDNGVLKNAPKIFKETCEIDWAQPAKRGGQTVVSGLCRRVDRTHRGADFRQKAHDEPGFSQRNEECKKITGLPTGYQHCNEPSRRYQKRSGSAAQRRGDTLPHRHRMGNWLRCHQRGGCGQGLSYQAAWTAR